MYWLNISLPAESSGAWAEGSCESSLHTCPSLSPSHFLNNWIEGEGWKRGARHSRGAAGRDCGDSLRIHMLPSMPFSRNRGAREAGDVQRFVQTLSI